MGDRRVFHAVGFDSYLAHSGEEWQAIAMVLLCGDGPRKWAERTFYQTNEICRMMPDPNVVFAIARSRLASLFIEIVLPTSF